MLPLLLAALAAPPALAEPALATLDNGLKVYVEPRPGSPSVAVALAVGVGSAWESPETNGAVHFLEHYLFTGTERWTETELQDEVERRGGTWNGTTTLHRTVYHVHLPASEAGFGLEWIDQVVFHPRFDPALFERERKVVFQERGGRKGRVASALERWGFGLNVPKARRELLFPGTGYAMNVVGEDESLDGLDLDRLRDFYEQHYVPANAALMVVGGVEVEPTLEAARRVFGELPSAPRPSPLPPLPPLAEERVATVRGPWDNDRETLSIGVRAVGLASPDWAPLRLLTQVLDKALTRELRQGRGLVYGVGASLSTYGETGELNVTTEALAQHTDEIRQVVTSALDDAVAGRVDPAALEDARAFLRGVYALAHEDNLNRALWCADFALSGDLPPQVDILLDAVTREQVAAVAARTLAPDLRREALHDPIITAWGGSMLGAGAVAGVAGLVGWRRRRANSG